MTDFFYIANICYALGLCEAGFSALRTLNRKAPEKIASMLADFLLAQGAGAYPLRAARP